MLKKLNLVLLIAFVVFIGYQLINGTLFIQPNSIHVIFVSFILIMLSIPYVNEIEIFGIRMKKEVEEIRTEIARLTSINENKLTSNQNLFIGPLNEALIQELVSADRPEGNADKESNQLKEPVQDSIRVPEDSIWLFKVRFQIEKVLRELDNLFEHGKSSNIFVAVKYLEKEGLVTENLSNRVVEVIKICNKGIHGESIKENHRQFVKLYYKEITQELESVIDMFWKR